MSMNPDDRRDFREETLLNAAEEQLLKYIAGRMGLTKSAALRMCLHHVGADLLRDERMGETGLAP